jgi:diketogulonate reductase-like aldo/keto reductase
MAYCPVGRAGALVTQDRVSKEQMVRDENVRAVAERHGCSIVQVLLAFVLRFEDMAAMPKAVGLNHIEENWAVRDITLTEEDIDCLSRSFPAPTEKVPMEKY